MAYNASIIIMGERICFFGVDSATWNVIMPYVKQGKLPGFALLLRQGTTKRLISTIPPITPTAWTSLYTGVNPGKHGVFDFYRMDKNHQITINTASNVSNKTLFDYLSDAGKRIAVLNLPLTYPARSVNGVMVTGFTTPGLERDFIYPRSLREEFLTLFPRYSFVERGRFGYTHQSQQRFLDNLLSSIDERITLFDWVEKKEPWDVFFINFMEVDHAQHWFWKFYDKSHPDYVNSPLEKAIYRVYERIDAYLLQMLKKGTYDRYVIFSDHGAGPYVENVTLNLLLLQEGLLHLKQRLFTRAKRALYALGLTPTNATRAALQLGKLHSPKPGTGMGRLQTLFLNTQDVDWDRTKAFSFGSYGQIYIMDNTKKTRERVVELMNRINYKGKPLITDLWQRERLYQGPFAKRAPDIMFSAQDFSLGASAISPFVAHTLFSAPHTLKSGEHRMEGIFGVYPSLTNQIAPQAETLSIYDVSATLLALAGVTVPSGWDGQSIVSEAKRNRPLDELDGIEV